MVKIFVGNLSPETRLEEVRKLFEKFGNVQECDIIKNYGFVHMEAENDAENAVKNLNGFSLHGRTLSVEYSTTKVRREPGMGGKDSCFHCGRKGHRSSECPSSRSGSNGKGRTGNGNVMKKHSDEGFSPTTGGIAPNRLDDRWFDDRSSFGAGAPPGSLAVYDPKFAPPPPGDRELEQIYDEYARARDRYYYYRDLLERRMSVGGSMLRGGAGARLSAGGGALAMSAPSSMSQLAGFAMTDDMMHPPSDYNFGRSPLLRPSPPQGLAPPRGYSQTLTPTGYGYDPIGQVSVSSAGAARLLQQAVAAAGGPPTSTYEFNPAATRTDGFPPLNTMQAAEMAAAAARGWLPLKQFAGNDQQQTLASFTAGNMSGLP